MDSEPARANARLLYPNPPRTKVQIQGFFASLRMTKFDGGYSNPEFALTFIGVVVLGPLQPGWARAFSNREPNLDACMVLPFSIHG